MRDRAVSQPSVRRQFRYIRRQLNIFRRHHVSILQQGLHFHRCLFHCLVRFFFHQYAGPSRFFP